MFLKCCIPGDEQGLVAHFYSSGNVQTVDHLTKKASRKHDTGSLLQPLGHTKVERCDAGARYPTEGNTGFRRNPASCCLLHSTGSILVIKLHFVGFLVTRTISVGELKMPDI